MPKPKRSQSKLTPYLTEKNLTFLLLLILVACASVLLTKQSMRATKIAEPLTIEQNQPTENQ